MFDRVIDITNKLEGRFDKKTIEQAILLYETKGHGAIDSLTATTSLSEKEAMQLLQEVEKEYLNGNRQKLIFSGVFLFLLLFGFWFCITSYFYFLSAITGLLLIFRIFALFRFIKRNRFKSQF